MCLGGARLARTWSKRSNVSQSGKAACRELGGIPIVGLRTRGQSVQAIWGNDACNQDSSSAGILRKDWLPDGRESAAVLIPDHQNFILRSPLIHRRKICCVLAGCWAWAWEIKCSPGVRQPRPHPPEVHYLSGGDDEETKAQINNLGHIFPSISFSCLWASPNQHYFTLSILILKENASHTSDSAVMAAGHIFRDTIWFQWICWVESGDGNNFPHNERGRGSVSLCWVDGLWLGLIARHWFWGLLNKVNTACPLFHGTFCKLFSQKPALTPPNPIQHGTFVGDRGDLRSLHG